MIIQNMIIKIFDKSEMQRLKTAFKTEIKKREKKSKTTQAKRLLSNNQSFHRSSVNQLNNQPGVQPRNEKFTSRRDKFRKNSRHSSTAAISRNKRKHYNFFLKNLL